MLSIKGSQKVSPGLQPLQLPLLTYEFGKLGLTGGVPSRAPMEAIYQY